MVKQNQTGRQGGLRGLGANIIGLLYPRRCPVCRQIVLPRGKLICPPCRKKLLYITEPSCKRCGRQLSRMEQEYCAECARRTFHYTRGYAVWQYNDAIRQSLGHFKYHARKEYADFYTSEAVRIYREKIRMEAPEVLIPVPIHSARRRERGFNQAELLAKGIGKRTGIPVDGRYLVRQRKTAPLKELTSKERARALTGAFRISDGQPSGKYRNIMLVDDIYTTGSTMEECTKVLLQAGAQKVTCLSVAIGASTN